MSWRRGALPAASVCLGLASLAPRPLAAASVEQPPTERPVSFSDLHGWLQDDLADAITVFRRSCDKVTGGSLVQPCLRAALLHDNPDSARRFFETAFDPVEVTSEGRAGFLTAYYEPEFPASLVPSGAMTMPLLTWPDRAASDTAALPDREAIEDGTLAALTRPIAYLDPVDAFTVHVQGSARLRLQDGSSLRVGYAGRNGQPYTSVARLLAERLGVEPATMDANHTVAWLKLNRPDGSALMRANRSYIFFKPMPDLTESDGPVGAEGVPLSPGRSVAVDSAAWPYGLPIWLEGTLPRPGGGAAPLGRLTVAQDTGAAIRGAVRADLFLGTGPMAGEQAGMVRERVRFVVLRPKVVGAGPVP